MPADGPTPCTDCAEVEALRADLDALRADLAALRGEVEFATALREQIEGLTGAPVGDLIERIGAGGSPLSLVTAMFGGGRKGARSPVVG